MSSQALLHSQVIQKAWEDPNFMELLKSDPKKALYDMMGITLPENVQLKTIQETAEEIYLVIPPKPSEMVASAGINVKAAW
ncbi:NHLP leader peptide family RiPP precursor [Paenibacillus sp. Z6-24]